ncbi:hypothetical protein SAMN05421636_103277 [Pricia antarctica]|uniref:UbiA prenyltransferase family protein n=1 Tax=Pricia antarctica TaxID=641691 RepID=A0A1G7AAW7_9FLAO|nr:hypothetical protein [Pricia antarctica]SDE11016.1 hypothetical protein SAMN05421636_103277 [Pricia antarctica]
MPILRRLFEFYLDASIHVAFAILAMVHVTSITLNISVDTHLSWFLFFGSIVCYNFVKYGVEAEKYILVTDLHQRHIQWVSFVAFVFALYHGYFLSLPVYITIAGLVALTGLYAIPVLPNARSLRSLGGLKIFVVAVVWAGSSVILPVIAAGESISWDVRVETIQRFLLVLILLVPFEIRDLAYDSPELRTLPQRFGIFRTKIMGASAIVPFFLMNLVKDSIGRTELIANAIICLVLGVLIWSTKRKQPRFFASFSVESVPILWWMLLLLSKGI